MGNILVLNAGSTSIKYKLFDETEKQLICDEFIEVEDYEKAMKELLRKIINHGEIVAVGHRVVHGGDKFRQPLLLTPENIMELEQYNHLAPLHNPYNLAGIRAAMSFLPQVPQVAIFDTAFYAELPEVARSYALPRKLSESHKLHRYGFHGASHEYVMQEAAKNLGKKIEKLNLITCHLGGGCSVTAIKNGRPIDTSMGHTPLEGLVMISRSGDIDPGLIIKLIKELPGEINEKKIDEVQHLLNSESGILGMTGNIRDFKELLRQVSQGQPAACAAFELFTYRLSKYIGSYWIALGGKLDAIIFTGSIGSGNPLTRTTVAKLVKSLGKVPIMAIETNEELLIARKVRGLVFA